MISSSRSIHLLARPGQPHGVLAHLKRGHSDTTGIGCLPRTVQNPGVHGRRRSPPGRSACWHLRPPVAHRCSTDFARRSLNLILRRTGKAPLAGCPRRIVLLLEHGLVGGGLGSSAYSRIEPRRAFLNVLTQRNFPKMIPAGSCTKPSESDSVTTFRRAQ